jgi:hypothetical protein
LYKDYGNARHYHIHAIQSIDQSPKPPDETSYRKSLQELSAILRHEWTAEVEATDNILYSDYHVTTMKCQIRGRHILALYDPTVGLNMISSSYLARNFPNAHRFQINQCLRDPYGNTLESKGIVKLISVSLEEVEALLDFYVFNVTYFNVFLGQPGLPCCRRDLSKRALMFKLVGKSTLYPSFVHSIPLPNNHQT